MAEEVENAVNAEIEEQVEEAAPDLPDTFSDLDDDELDACLCTDSEAQTKKAIWDHTHRCLVHVSTTSFRLGLERALQAVSCMRGELLAVQPCHECP